MNDETKIKRKIFNLLQKTVDSGCTEGEAMAAAEKAGELMDQYSLSITDIQIMESECLKKEYEMHNAGRGRMGNMAVGIARYCDVKVWITRGTRDWEGKVAKKGILHFFGIEADVDMALFLMDIVKNAMDRGIVDFKKSDYWQDNVIGMPRGEGKRHTTGFRNGFASRIGSRLDEMKDERNEAMDVQQKNMEEVLGEGRAERTGRSIVAVKTNHVEDEFKKLGMNLSGGGSTRWGGDYGAREEGRNAASNVHLGSGVGSDGGVKMIGNG